MERSLQDGGSLDCTPAQSGSFFSHTTYAANRSRSFTPTPTPKPSVHDVEAPSLPVDALRSKVAEHLRLQRRTPAIVAAEKRKAQQDSLADIRRNTASAHAHRSAKERLYDLIEEQDVSQGIVTHFASPSLMTGSRSVTPQCGSRSSNQTPGQRDITPGARSSISSPDRRSRHLPPALQYTQFEPIPVVARQPPVPFHPYLPNGGWKSTEEEELDRIARGEEFSIDRKPQRRAHTAVGQARSPGRAATPQALLLPPHPHSANPHGEHRVGHHSTAHHSVSSASFTGLVSVMGPHGALVRGSTHGLPPHAHPGESINSSLQGAPGHAHPQGSSGAIPFRQVRLGTIHGQLPTGDKDTPFTPATIAPLPMPDSGPRLQTGTQLLPMTQFAQDTPAALTYLNSRTVEETAVAANGDAVSMRARNRSMFARTQFAGLSARNSVAGHTGRSSIVGATLSTASPAPGGAAVATRPLQGPATTIARSMEENVADITQTNGGVVDAEGGPLPAFEDDHVWAFEEDNMTREAREELTAHVDRSTTFVKPKTTVPALGSPADLAGRLRARLRELEQQTDQPRAFQRMMAMRGHRGQRDGAAVANPTDVAESSTRKAEKAFGRSGIVSTKWCHIDPMVTFDPDFRISELETNIPQQDLHLYQLYCYYNKAVIMIRPVSDAVPGLYAGNFFLHHRFCDQSGQPLPQPHQPLNVVRAATTHECRVKGKSISVSLKSSSYAPICGLIPVNPGLSKAYIEAQRREREIEDLILNAKGGVVTIALLKKLKAQKAQAGNLTQTFRREIENSLRKSDATCTALLEKYKAELVVTVDKGAVSQSYINKFNDAQFLGTTNALWRGNKIFYRERDDDPESVVRDEKDRPVFYILFEKDNEGAHYYEYLPEANDISKSFEEKPAGMRSVQVVTHRIFFTSSTTQRIEEEPESYLIGPDFDGLSYASKQKDERSLPEQIEWAERCIDQKLVPSMGLVNEFDQEHVRDMRLLTAWKQNHGYECNNTVKTQPLGHGVYTVITPNNVSILTTFTEIVSYIRKAWVRGYPLPLNPNWKVAIGPDHLPRPYGEDLSLPVADDGGWGGLMQRLDHTDDAPSPDSLKLQYLPMEDRVEEFQAAKRATTTTATAAAAAKAVAHATVGHTAHQVDEDHPLLTHAHVVMDRRYVIQLFFDLRRWQLFPPWFVSERREKERTERLINEPMQLIDLETRQSVKTAEGQPQQAGGGSTTESQAATARFNGSNTTGRGAPPRSLPSSRSVVSKRGSRAASRRGSVVSPKSRKGTTTAPMTAAAMTSLQSPIVPSAVSEEFDIPSTDDEEGEEAESYEYDEEEEGEESFDAFPEFQGGEYQYGVHEDSVHEADAMMDPDMRLQMKQEIWPGDIGGDPYAPKVPLVPSPEFEQFRKEKVEAHKPKFLEAIEHFTILHGKNELCDRLKDFIDPPTAPTSFPEEDALADM